MKKTKIIKLVGWLLKYNDWYVWTIAIVSVYAILQIKLDFAFWIANSDKADAYNEIITNLSYSYLAGFIFFLLTVTLPHWKMRTKIRKALEGKTNTICSNYKACVESVVPLPKTVLPTITREEAVENFKAVSYHQPCRLTAIQNTNVSIVVYIKLKHDENKRLATELLEYKPWLSSETIAKIEEIRNSNLPTIIITLTNTIMKDQMDNENGRKMLGEMVFDLWMISKEIGR